MQNGDGRRGPDGPCPHLDETKTSEIPVYRATVHHRSESEPKPKTRAAGRSFSTPKKYAIMW